MDIECGEASYKTQNPITSRNEDIEEFITPHEKMILAKALQLSRDMEMAEDLAQETIHQGIIKFWQLRDRTKCKYWLLTILRNLFFKEINNKKRIVYWDDAVIANQLVDKSTPEIEFLSHEATSGVQNVVDGLSDFLRLPIQLFYFENFSYKAISEELDIPMGTVMSRIYRGKKQLQVKLALQLTI